LVDDCASEEVKKVMVTRWIVLADVVVFVGLINLPMTNNKKN
jgi:hypothetical protein